MAGYELRMEDSFTKRFNDGYWLSREESILSYLHQRNAAVPRVLFKDTVEKVLVLENIGSSLNEIFLAKEMDSRFLSSFLLLTLEAIKSLEQIFNLGILHLDIALRNVGAENIHSSKVYILDFSHSISQHNLLQKPLNLIPTENLHHPDLFNALMIDWINYCNYFDIKDPKIDVNFEISSDDFIKYWPHSLEVQNLVSSKRILCHGIGNLLFDAYKNLPAKNRLRPLYLSTSKSLLNLKEDEADYFLFGAIQKLEYEMQVIDAWAAEKTPIPRNSSESQKPEDITLNRREETFNKPISNISLTVKEVSSIKSSAESIPTLVFAIDLIAWICVAVNGYWINLLIDVGNVRLSDKIILLIISLTLCGAIFLGISFLVKKSKSFVYKNIALLITCLLEFTVLAQFTNTIFTHLWLWVPSALIAIIVLAYSCVHLWKQKISIIH